MRAFQVPKRCISTERRQMVDRVPLFAAPTRYNLLEN